MSWDVSLTDDRGHEEGWWNYTHNCNGMVNAALDEAGYHRPPDTTPCLTLDRESGEWVKHPDGTGQPTSWWRVLDGLSGPEGAQLLDTAICRLEADPDRFRSMNPDNGWGDYDSLLKTLRDMRSSVPEWPCKWEASG